MGKKQRIVVTGIGVVSNIGIGKTNYWDALKKGHSGIKPITFFDTSSFKTSFGGEINDFDAKAILGQKGLRLMDRTTRLACSASKLALDDAEITINDANRFETGVVLGTTMGSLKSIVDLNVDAVREGPHYINPALFPNTVFNSPASQIAIRLSLKGLNYTFSTGFSASLDALGQAKDCIKLGRAKRVLVGGVEEMCLPTFLGFYKSHLMVNLNEQDPLTLNCPFDKRRKGLFFAEGSSILIIETLGAALEREAHIYAEILGHGTGFHFSHQCQYPSDGRALKTAMRSALKDALLEPQDIDFVCANGNSSPKGDKIETEAIKDVFAAFARKLSLSSVKSMIGETYSAGGAMALSAAVGVISRGILPPTINYKEQDPFCDLDYVPNVYREKDVNTVMVNAMNPGGNSTSVILSKYYQ